MNDDYPSARSRARERKSVLIGLILVGTVAGVIVYFALSRTDVDIYVDNGGTEPITVLADGSEKLVVAPGQIASFPCRAGSLHIVAKRGETVVFDATKVIVEGKPDRRRKYLLNPEATNRYRTIELAYVRRDPKIPTYIDRTEPDLKSADMEQQLRLAVAELKLMQATDWIESAPDYVMESPPLQVSAKKRATIRTVLRRVPKEEADYVLKTLAAWDKQGAASQSESLLIEYAKFAQAAQRIWEASR